MLWGVECENGGRLLGHLLCLKEKLELCPIPKTPKA
jgi:hypothetical protein